MDSKESNMSQLSNNTWMVYIYQTFLDLFKFKVRFLWDTLYIANISSGHIKHLFRQLALGKKRRKRYPEKSAHLVSKLSALSQANTWLLIRIRSPP